MDDVHKAGIYGIIGALIGAIATFIATPGENDYKSDTVELLSTKFDLVDQKMSYEDAIATIYDSYNKALDENSDLEDSVEEISNKATNLEKDVSDYKKEISTLNERLEVYQNRDDKTQEESESNVVSLKDFPTFNTQFLNGNNWRSGELVKWDINSKAADGNTYEDAMIIAIDTGYDVNGIITDYYLSGDYSFFSTTYMLDELCKSTPSQAIMNIYGDGKIIYTSPTISGGFTPTYTGELEINGVKKLTIEIVGLESRTNLLYFGLVLIEPHLL